MNQKIIVFASGTATGGGSGFENVATHSRMYAEWTQNDAQKNAKELFDYEVVGVVSNYENGGVRKRADRLGVPFVYFNGPFNAEHYTNIVADSGAEWVALSGWLKHVSGLDPVKTFNIHPALLSFDHGRFGGPGLYGHHVHEAVKDALDGDEITESGLSMHFVTDEYDRGPVFFEYRVPLQSDMTADDIGSLVNKAEHEWQPKITNMVVHAEIRWDGTNPESLIVPEGYSFLPQPPLMA